jgi:hypothetical protein
MPTTTPWGKSQTKQTYIRGINFYSTSSHGGIHVSEKLNQKIHVTWRNDNGWYEEDCEWAIVGISFPEICSKEELELAHKTAKEYFPHEYEIALGIIVLPSESAKLREELFYELHKDDYIVLSAITHDKEFVKVIAGKGGRLINGMYPDDTKEFLVPTEEYNNRYENFAIDLNRHEELIEN